MADGVLNRAIADPTQGTRYFYSGDLPNKGFFPMPFLRDDWWRLLIQARRLHSTRTRRISGVAVRALGLSILVVIVQVMLSPAQAETQQAMIARAITQQICMEKLWRYSDRLPQGSTSHISYKSANGRIYAWSGDLSKAPYVSRMGDVFEIMIQGQQSLVVTQQGYNLDDPDQAQVFKLEGDWIPGAAQTMSYTYPINCTPHFDPSSPWKEQTIRRVLERLKEESKLIGWNGHPTKLKVIIGNFDFHYWEVLVFIPALNELVHVSLRDETDPQKDPAVLTGLVVRPEFHRRIVNEEKPIILKYGITRTIQ